MWEQGLGLKINKEKWDEKCVKAQTQTGTVTVQLAYAYLYNSS